MGPTPCGTAYRRDGSAASVWRSGRDRKAGSLIELESCVCRRANLAVPVMHFYPGTRMHLFPLTPGSTVPVDLPSRRPGPAPIFQQIEHLIGFDPWSRA